ncbi:MAG TPA: serine/threonine-protein kinase [Polyangiaceae bacterium]
MAHETSQPEQVIGGDFVVKRDIKAGGFGAVYEAHQLSTGQRKLAANDPHASSRFRTEATAASQIQSAYVVQVIAAGVDSTHGPWIAMEYLRGHDLADWVRVNGPMARQVLQQLCHALGAAHRVNIAHRDLKPENIFLAESSGLEGPFIAKVLDFGIAKAFEGTSTTTAGISSWAWLAPEQAAVRSHLVQRQMCGHSVLSPSSCSRADPIGSLSKKVRTARSSASSRKINSSPLSCSGSGVGSRAASAVT